MKALRIGIAATLFTAVTVRALPALAEPEHEFWHVVGNKAFVDYIDAASLASDGDVKRGWLWLFYSVEDAHFSAANVRGIVEVNCRSQQYRRLQYTLYNRDGTVLTSSDASAWSAVTPDNVSDAELEFLCADARTRASFGTRLPQGMAPAEHAQAYFDFLDPPNDSIIAKTLSGIDRSVITPETDAPP